MISILAVMLAGATPLPPPTLWRDPKTLCLYMLYALRGGRFRAEMLNTCLPREGMKSTCPQTIIFYPPRKANIPF